jgi:hypothetical protein
MDGFDSRFHISFCKNYFLCFFIFIVDVFGVRCMNHLDKGYVRLIFITWFLFFSMGKVILHEDVIIKGGYVLKCVE